MNTQDARLGLTLTRCDLCNCRQYCAVNGAALCGNCCPGAVEDAQDQARKAIQLHAETLQRDRWARMAAEEVELLPGEYTGPSVPFQNVAHLFNAHGRFA